MKYSEILTTKETMRVLGLPYRSKLDQPHYGLSDRLDMRPIKIGDQRGFTVTRVEAALRKLFDGKPDDYREAYLRLIEIRQHIENVRDENMEEYVDVNEAMKITGITTREGIYWHCDFRGRKVRTVKFGHVRLFNLKDLHALAKKRAEYFASPPLAGFGGAS